MRRIVRFFLILLVLAVLALAAALSVSWPLRWLPAGLPPGGWKDGTLTLWPGPTLRWPAITLAISRDSLRLESLSLKADGLGSLRRWWSADEPLLADLRVSHAQWNRLPLEGLSGRMRLVADTLEVQNLHSRLAGQALDGRWLVLRKPGALPAWTLDLQSERLVLDSLWALLYPERSWTLGGLADVTLRIRQSRSGRTSHSFVAHARDVELASWPVALELKKQLGLEFLDPLMADSLSMELVGDTVSSRLNRMELWTSLGLITASGPLGNPEDPTQKMALAVDLALNESGRRQLSLPGGLDQGLEWLADPDGILHIKGTVTGSLEKPELRVDTSALKKKVEEGVRSLFRKLLGRH